MRLLLNDLLKKGVSRPRRRGPQKRYDVGTFGIGYSSVR